MNAWKAWRVVVGCLMIVAVGATARAAFEERIPLWPLLRYDPQPNHTDLEVLWPLLMDVEKTPDETTWRVLLTVYNRKSGDNKTTWDFLWPIWRMQLGGTERHSRFVPLFFGRDSNERYIVLFPEVWWFNRTDTERYTFFMLPWGRYHDGETDYMNFLTPFFWGRSGNHRRVVVLPLGWWNKRSEDHYTVVCLLAFRLQRNPQDHVTGFLPWWVEQNGQKQNANFFPVLWSKDGDEYKSFVVLPLYYNLGEKAVFFPLYWDFKETKLILPIYGKGKLGKADWEAYGPGSWIRWSKGDYSETDILYPIVQWGEGKDEFAHVVRPFYDYRRKGDYYQRSTLLHLAVRGRGGDRKLDRVFPLFNYDRTSEKSDLSVLWPVYREKEARDSVQQRLLSLLPIGLFKTGADSDSLNFLTLFYWAKSRLAADTTGFLQMHGLYPLYSFTRERKALDMWDPTAKGEKYRGKASKENMDLRTFKVLDLFTGLTTAKFDPTHSPLEILKLFLPLFLHQSASNGYQKWALPLALFRYEKGTLWEKGQDRYFHLTLGTPLVFDCDRWTRTHLSPPDEQKGLHVLSLFWDNKHKDYHSQGLWPLYSYKTAGKSVNASALDPLWFWGKATGEEEHVSALFKILDYRKQSNGDSRFSVIWRAYRRDKRGDTVASEMIPFLAWEKSPERSKVSFFWRVFAYEKSSGQKTMRLFFLPKFSLGGGGK